MRKSSNVSILFQDLTPAKTFWTNGADALKDALNLEAAVTKRIRDLIKVCEDDVTFNDYHVSYTLLMLYYTFIFMFVLINERSVLIFFSVFVILFS